MTSFGLLSFINLEDSKECQDYAAESMAIGAPEYMSVGEVYAAYSFYYEYCEAHCTQCNTPNK
jgi:hypothetical protein